MSTCDKHPPSCPALTLFHTLCHSPLKKITTKITQVEAYCIANLIHSVMDSNDEFLVLDIHFVSSNGGMARAFELLHEVLTQPRWVGGAHGWLFIGVVAV